MKPYSSFRVWILSVTQLKGKRKYTLCERTPQEVKTMTGVLGYFVNEKIARQGLEFITKRRAA